MQGLVMGYAACDETQTATGIRQMESVFQMFRN